MHARLIVAYIIVCAGLLLASCGGNMRDQAKCRPYEASAAFPDGTCAQQLPPNTVARAFVRDFDAERAGGQPSSALPALPNDAVSNATTMPFPITREVLVVGQDRFNTFCVPCHGMAGYGDGMIVQRGFPAPPSFHSDRLRAATPGYIVTVITNGYGVMYSYADRVPPQERWAIAAYIKALQLSQHAAPADVPPDQRNAVQGATP